MDEQSKPVIRVLLKPQFEDLPDGTIRGSYPGENWSVVGATRAEVIKLMQAEYGERASTRESTEALLALIERVKAEPVEGVEMNVLTDAEYSDRMRENENRINDIWTDED
jgi:hypothetical protein